MWRTSGALVQNSRYYKIIQRDIWCDRSSGRSLSVWTRRTSTGELLSGTNLDVSREKAHVSQVELETSTSKYIDVPKDTYMMPTAATETKLAECSGKQGSPGPQNDKHDDYYANMGDALRTLREDIPHLFRKELNYSIYRDDIVFKDSRLEFQGIKNYKIIFWSLKFHGQLFFRHMNVEILRIWQPEDYVIKMRWQVNGYPRVWWEAEGRIDGISTYKLDKNGKIYEHSIDNVQLRDPPIENPLLYGMNWIYYPSNQPHSLPMPGS